MYILKCKKIWNVNIVVVQIIVKMAMQEGFSVITAKTVNAIGEWENLGSIT